MTTRPKVGVAAVALVVALIGAALGHANGVQGKPINACYDNATGKLRFTNPLTNVPKGCTTKEAALRWDDIGEPGPQGPQGAQGPVGEQGPPGPPDRSAQPFLAQFNRADIPAGTALPGTGSMCTIGRVRLTAGRVAAGGLPADGRLLDISENEVLYDLIGTTYGGDGTTTFALPDLRPITPNGLTYSVCIFGIYPQQS